MGRQGAAALARGTWTSVAVLGVVGVVPVAACGSGETEPTSVCGDGTCAADESARTCPADCPAVCGDDRCTPSESPSSCPADCGTCGDGICNLNESSEGCPGDCFCGNGACDLDEDWATCIDDCGACGNGMCDAGETSDTCPADCNCGNGSCDAGEDDSRCPQDCSSCGNGSCDPTDVAYACPTECDGLGLSSEPIEIAGVSDAVAIAGGDASSCALSSDGTVRCWGRGYGYVPIAIPGLPPASALSGSCALVMPGTVWCWPPGGSAVRVDGLEAVRSFSASPVEWQEAVGCAGLASGRVACWRLADGSSPAEVPGLSEVEQVSVGREHACAVAADGTVWCWGWHAKGWDGYGYGPVPVAVSGVDATSIVASTSQYCNGGCKGCYPGDQLTYALRSDGTIWSWAPDGPLAPVAGIDEAASFAMNVGCWTGCDATCDYPMCGAQTFGGAEARCVARTSGEVRCWGSNQSGQLGSSPGVAGATAVSVGGGWCTWQYYLPGCFNVHVCALLADGRVWCWGANYEGQLAREPAYPGYCSP